MKNFFKNQIAVSILIGALLISAGIIAYALINNNSNDKSKTLDSIMNQDKIFVGANFENKEYILGNDKNDVVVVVYSDFECPFCKMLQENVIEKLQEKYKTKSDLSEGKIGIVYRHFAQSYHDKAPTEINASLCARELYGQNVYKNFISRIYNISPTNNGLDLGLLPEIAEYSINKAKEAKQDIKKDFSKEEFISCFNNMTYNQEFMDNSNDAITAGLEGTPYSLIVYRDGEENVVISKISGLREVSYFERIIDKLIKLK